jgi:phenylacetate-CoA ligase
MLANPELIREAAQINRLEAALPRWRERGLYRTTLAGAPARLESFPIITKQDVRRAFPNQLLPTDQTLDDLLARELIELEHTSGTSEDRLPVVFGRTWWNEQEERALRLNPVVAAILDEHPAIRRVTITTPACNGLTCPTVWASPAQRTFGNSLFVNLARIPFVLADAELRRMAEETAAWSPQFLDLDPVHGVWFALFCERHGLRFPSLRFIVCSYEFVSVVHRRILQRVFGVPVFNLYGSTETGHLLMETGSGAMKASHDTAVLEVVETDAAGVGTLLVTTLSNDFMPLLRYRIGDLVQRNEHPYATDYLVHGRSRDALTAADGRRVTTWQVDQCLADADGIAHYQLRPTGGGEFRLRYLADSGGPGETSLQQIVAGLSELLKSRVTTESVSTLIPEASGKFRLTSPLEN